MRHAWIRRPEILDYVIESYAGQDDKPDGRGKRRVFIWQAGEEIVMGNAEAFIVHLNEKFGMVLPLSASSALHELLRALGEQVKRNHETHDFNGRKVGQFKQPEPEEWVVGRVTPEEEP